MRCLIKNNNGLFVAGFNHEHQIIQESKDVKYAIGFDSKAAALAYIDQYGNCGYGLSKDGNVIVNAPNTPSETHK